MFVLIQASAMSFGDSQRPSVNELLSRLEETLGAYTNIRAKDEVVTRVTGTAHGNKPAWFKDEVDFRYDGQRYDIIRRSWRDLDGDNAPTPVEAAQNYRQMWDGEHIFDHWFFDGDDVSNVDSAVTISIDVDSYGHNVPYYNSAVLLGIMGSDLRPVSEILREADELNLRDGMDMVGESDCYVIEVSGKNGQYTLWIDPQHGYNIAQAKVRKREGDIVFGEPMGQREDSVKVSELLPQALAITRYDFELSNVKFEKVGDKWVPVAGQADVVLERGKDNLTEYTRRHERTLVDIDPDFEAIGAFVADLPDGLKIMIPEAPGVQYVWQDGRAVPSLDEFVPESIDFAVMKEVSSGASGFAAKGHIETVSSVRVDLVNPKDNLQESPVQAEANGLVAHGSSAMVIPWLILGLGLALMAWGFFKDAIRPAKGEA